MATNRSNHLTKNSRMEVSALRTKRPSRRVQRFEWLGVGCAATIHAHGLLLLVEVIHPKFGKSYSKMAKSVAELNILLERANFHAMSLGMELMEEVVK